MLWFNSPAKINRFLYIKGRLPNGYHEIVTLFEKIAFFDRIGIEIKDDDNSHIEISCPEWLPKGPENLVFQAVKAFREATDLRFSVFIKLHKEIPTGAGLGGGSSNCGITLKVLNQFFDSILSESQLLQLAASIGADCPFFVSSWIGAIGTGTGATLEDFPLEINWYLLVLPGFSVNTRWAYENFKLTRQRYETIFEPRKVRSGYKWINDLEKPVCSRYPAISRIKSNLMEAGAKRALMSGSGSTVFGVFDTEEEALKAQTQIKNKTGYRCLVTRTVKHDEIV